MKPWIFRKSKAWLLYLSFEYEFHILDKDKFHTQKAVLNKVNSAYQ